MKKEKQTGRVNMVLPPCFGGEFNPNTIPSGEELMFRSKCKLAISGVALDLDVQTSDVITGMVPLLLEMALECLDPDHYDEAIGALDQLFNDYVDGLKMPHTKRAVTNALNNLDSALDVLSATESEIKLTRKFDWS
mgnify:CR=1 FL=1